MQESLGFFESKSFTIILTIAIVIFSQILRVVCTKYIEKKKNNGDEEDNNYRYTVNLIKNFINIITLVLVFILWSSEIQEFAISIAAFTVAIVLATKELLQSFLGFLYITSSRIFKVGDWIEIGDELGEVIDIDWFKTTLLEINPEKYGFTGKTTFVSNNFLLTASIQNLNFMKRYVHYSFSIIKDDVGVNPYCIREELINKIKEHCSGFENIAERYNSLIENKLGVKFIKNEPHVDIKTTSLGKIECNMSFFCPTDQIQPLEDKITENFFALWYETLEKQKELSKK